MSVNPSKETAQPTAFELKAGSFTLPLLRLLESDMEAVASQLAVKVQQAPDFFRNTPVVIDLKTLAGEDVSVDFALLVGLLRGYGMIPVGVRGGNEAQNDAAFAMELAVLSDLRTKKPGAQTKATKPAAAPAQSQGSLLVTRPVRSGQRIYATGSDLVIVAAVSSGAEVMADGNIHVYGTLRGRALAGVQGNQACRIFCHNLQAELISVAGHYRISENLDAAKRGKPVQIYLDGQSLKIDEL